MARGTPVDLGTRRFAKKAEVTDFFRDMLNRYSVGEIVKAYDEILLRALIERHPERDQKVDVGIKHFEVRDSSYGTRCFWLVRIDESVRG